MPLSLPLSSLKFYCLGRREQHQPALSFNYSDFIVLPLFLAMVAPICLSIKLLSFICGGDSGGDVVVVIVVCDGGGGDKDA